MNGHNYNDRIIYITYLNYKEVRNMMNEKKNNSIGCTVDTCKYHCQSANYCTKNVIEVGSCNCDAKTSDATCCQSFEMRAK